MSLLDKIEQIQKKPQRERKRILVIVMAVSMSFIVAIWITNLQYSMGADNAISDEPKPFSLVWSSIKQSSGNITEEAKKDFSAQGRPASGWEVKIEGTPASTTTEAGTIQKTIEATGASTTQKKSTTTQTTID